MNDGIPTEHTITEADLKADPRLAELGHKVGDIITLPIEGGEVDTGVSPKEAIDLTKMRDARCYPIVKKMLKMMLKEKVHFDDRQYLIARVKQMTQEFLDKMIITVLAEDTEFILEVLNKSLEESYNRASEAMWEKVATDLTIKDIDDKLNEKGVYNN